MREQSNRKRGIDWEGNLLYTGTTIGGWIAWLMAIDGISEVLQTLGHSEKALQPEFFLGMPAVALLGLAAAKVSRRAKAKYEKLWDKRYSDDYLNS